MSEPMWCEIRQHYCRCQDFGRRCNDFDEEAPISQEAWDKLSTAAVIRQPEEKP